MWKKALRSPDINIFCFYFSDFWILKVYEKINYFNFNFWDIRAIKKKAAPNFFSRSSDYRWGIYVRNSNIKKKWKRNVNITIRVVYNVLVKQFFSHITYLHINMFFWKKKVLNIPAQTYMVFSCFFYLSWIGGRNSTGVCVYFSYMSRLKSHFFFL